VRAGSSVRSPVSSGPSRAHPVMIDRTVKIKETKVWGAYANSGDLEKGGVVSGFQYNQEIAIARTKSGKVYALSNKLPPTGQPATFGEVEGETIIDPISGTKFSLATGKVQGKWCPNALGQLLLGRIIGQQDVPVYQVRERGGKIEVNINVNAKASFEQQYWRGVLDAQGKVDGGYY